MKQGLISTTALGVAIGLTAFVAASSCSTCANAADFLPIAAGAVDPTVLHITAAGATGADPVSLNTATSFTVTNVSGQTIPSPIDIFYAVPVGDAAPITPGVGGVIATMSGSQDLYTQIGCAPCNNSLNAVPNFQGALAAIGLPAASTFDIFESQIGSGLAGGASVTVDGTFAQGTFIAPLAEDTATGTIFDTSFTNTGFVNVIPPGGHVPEPSTLLVFGTAVGSLMLLRKRARKGTVTGGEDQKAA